jgi:hypothetical protein
MQAHQRGGDDRLLHDLAAAERDDDEFRIVGAQDVEPRSLRVWVANIGHVNAAHDLVAECRLRAKCIDGRGNHGRFADDHCAQRPAPAQIE